MDSDGLPGLLRDLTRIARELPARIVFENSHHLARLPEPVRRRVLSSLDGRPLRGRRLDSPRFASPLERRAFFVSSEYGLREHNRHHNGIDLAAESGTPIMAAADGVVADVRTTAACMPEATAKSHASALPLSPQGIQMSAGLRADAAEGMPSEQGLPGSKPNFPLSGRRPASESRN